MKLFPSFMDHVSKEIIFEIKNIDLQINSENCNQEINKLLQKTVLFGGKRLRPLLTHLFGNLFGLPIKTVSPYARAIEMVHAASLSHDDVIDNATQRRGIKSINIEGSNKMAILAGDYLLAEVIVELSSKNNLLLVKEMATVIKDLAEGEWIQDDALKSRHYTREIIEQIALKKTASVMSYCSVAPAVLANSSSQVIDLCREFGKNLGLAFQLMDDTLDLSNNSKKDIALDLKNGLVNSVIYEWLLFNPGIHKKYKNGDSLESLWDGKDLNESITLIQDRAYNHLELAKNYLNLIVEKIEITDSHQVKKALIPLEEILVYLGQRSN
ncbi:MAG: polyprenyl synthetase family protein [Bacteriovoracales bacterium]